MDKTSTRKLIKFNSKQKTVSISKHIWVNNDDPFEQNLAELLDRELVNPRKKIIEEILKFSKRNL
jgi:hypothetical protein